MKMDKKIESTSRWLFISDLDDTLLGDDAALRSLARNLQKHREKIVIVYNSSRPCESIRKSLGDYPALQELSPEFIVGALGTEIQDGSTGKPVSEYSHKLIDGWNREKIAQLLEELRLKPHPEELQTPFKASYYVQGNDQYLTIKEKLADHGFRVKVIFSGGCNLDIIPHNSGKGSAVEFIWQYLSIDKDQVVVSGDSANDIDMFTKASKGIVVGNADPELKSLTGDKIYLANAAYAAGVLEGLQYWGVIPSD